MNRFYFSDNEISTIRERSNILEIVSNYVSLKKSGKNYKGLCPFHSEKTPSFMVNEEKQIFHCFGCGEGGNVFSFLMKIKNITFPEAVEELAKRYGIRINPKEISVREKRELEKRELLLELNQIVTEYFHKLLQSHHGEEARRYLSQRGIEREIIEEYKLGYSLDKWDGLVKYLKERRASLDLASEAGLIIPKKIEGWYDTFRNRIIFPIFDLHNRIIGFGGRILGDGEPKYINSPESILYHKSETLYGTQVAKRFISEKDEVILVEGYFDLLTLHQSGIKNSVASLGTALTSQHLQILKRYTKNIYMVFDADEAGFKASIRSLPLLLEEDMTGKIITLPEGEDPDIFLRKRGKKEFERLISNPISLLDFFFERLTKVYDLRRLEGKLGMAKEAIAILNKIPDGIKRGLYIKTLAEKIDLQESILYEAIQSTSKFNERRKIEVKLKGIKKDFPKSEEMLIQLMIHHPEHIPTVFKHRVLQDFQDIKLKRIGEEIKSVFTKRGKFQVAELLNLIDEDLRNLVGELSFSEIEIEKEKVEKVLKDCIRKIKEEKLKKDKKELLKKIKEVEKEGGVNILEGLLKKRQELAIREKALGEMI